MKNDVIYIFKHEISHILPTCSLCVIFQFRTPNVYRNYYINEVLMECFTIYLCNTPIFAQSSLRQGTISTYHCVINQFSNDTQ